MSYNNIVSKINKYFLLFALFTISFTISSCSTSNDAVNDDSPIINPEEPSEPTNIHPILEWGKSMSEIKTKQKSLVNDVENDTLLRFTNKSKTIVVDYFFKNNSLVSASMTQANIANVKDIMDKWANGYTEIASNDNDFVSVSSDKPTLVYGKTLAGTNYNYASVAWSAINSSDEDNDELESDML